jgi:hypothetical protein
MRCLFFSSFGRGSQFHPHALASLSVSVAGHWVYALIVVAHALSQSSFLPQYASRLRNTGSLAIGLLFENFALKYAFEGYCQGAFLSHYHSGQYTHEDDHSSYTEKERTGMVLLSAAASAYSAHFYCRMVVSVAPIFGYSH